MRLNFNSGNSQAFINTIKASVVRAGHLFSQYQNYPVLTMFQALCFALIDLSMRSTLSSGEEQQLAKRNNTMWEIYNRGKKLSWLY